MPIGFSGLSARGWGNRARGSAACGLPSYHHERWKRLPALLMAPSKCPDIDVASKSMLILSCSLTIRQVPMCTTVTARVLIRTPQATVLLILPYDVTEENVKARKYLIWL